MTKLLIVESPAKAKTIGKYLGKDFTVVASVGHVRDLPKSNKIAIDIDAGFVPHYEISPGKEKILDEIRALAEKSDEILLATDPDREGEAIAWHIAEELQNSPSSRAELTTGQAKGKKEKLNIKRVVYHEITKDAIEEAIKHPRPIDQNLRKAQEARRVLDRLVGYGLSGLIWKKVRYGLSAGRVQSPALRIIVEREREIKAFIPETFWRITADTQTDSKQNLIFGCTEEPRDKKQVDDILKKGNSEAWKIFSIEEAEVKRSPRAPFTTSTLQQTASSRLGFSPSRTMSVAQRLYEAGYITYMRTDSTNLSKIAVDQIASVIEKNYGKDYLQIRTYATKSKNAQEAHEAVRPTDALVKSAGKTPEQQKLYDLIWARAISSQMALANILRTKVTANIESHSIPDFTINGSRLLYAGWLKADPESRGDDVELPKLTENEPLKLIELKTEEKQTEPPSRYTEAGLVKELEARGIGRPSTYASTIKTIQDRGYVEKEARSLRPTDTGEVVSTFLEDNFMHYINDTFTAEMENKLDAIADGSEDYVKTLSDFYKPFAKDVKAKDKIDKITNLGEAGKEFKCPKCGGSMIIKLGRAGKFLSCARFPDCTGMLQLDGQEVPKDKIIGVHPETNKEITLKTGKYGPYVEMPTDEMIKKKPKLRRASVPKEVKPEEVTLDQAVHYLSLPRGLGNHPETGKTITANIGRFGPYIVHEKDFRSLKTDDVYKITLDRALEVLKEPKKPRGFARGRRLTQK